MSDVSRRKFVQTAAGAGAALTIVPRHVLGRGFQAPSDTVNLATVGIGGMGGSNTRALMSQNFVAICDVDAEYADERLEGFKKAAENPPSQTGPVTRSGRQRVLSKPQEEANARRPRQDDAANLRKFADNMPRIQRYTDYREMLDKQKELDAIVVATPDHMHAAIASAAMSVGKHVYVQKPLCWSVQEARHLAKKAKENPKLVTQMGNQGHSGDGARTGYEYLTAGAIGDIREIHVWTNRPYGYWPQGIPRPAPVPESAQKPRNPWRGPALEARLAAAMYGDYPVPAGLDWNLFLGAAPEVPYHPIYHPFSWRGWVDWGQGALGDMGAHLIDHPFWALKLGMPTVIETRSTPFNGATFPTATTTYYDFPKRGNLPAVKLTWYDGGLTPPKPEEIGDEPLNGEGGILYIGSKGKMLQDTYGLNPRLLPKSQHESYGTPKTVLKRVAHEEHEMNWIEAIQGKAEISCPFEYATALTEVMLLGIVALRAGSKIHYDGDAMKVTNTVRLGGERVIDPNDFLKRDNRAGFELR
jgi:predicted dehydrogenase